jgi:hypothetical protein
MDDMVESKINYRVHVIFWLLLMLFPVASGLMGGVSLAQRMMHMFFLAYILVCVIVFQKRLHGDRNFFQLALLYVFLNVSYYGFVVIFNGSDLTGIGLVDLVRPLVYFTYFLIPFFFPLTERQFARIIKMVLIVCFLQIGFSTFVYFEPLWILVDLYKGRTSEDIFLFQFFRWSGTFGFPADFSFFLSFFLYFLVFSMRYRLYDLKVTLIGLTAVTFALVMTVSRGGLATVAIMMVPAMLMVKGIRGGFYYAGVGLIFILAFYMAMNLFESEFFKIDYATQLLEHGFEAESAAHRIHELKFALKYMTDMFPIGIGPDRARTETVLPVLETLYGHLLIKWGIAGYLLYLVPVAYFSKITYGLWKTHEDRLISSAMGAAFILIVSVPLIFGLSSAITDRFKGLPFFYILMGYAIMLYQRDKGQLNRTC